MRHFTNWHFVSIISVLASVLVVRYNILLTCFRTSLSEMDKCYKVYFEPKKFTTIFITYNFFYYSLTPVIIFVTFSHEFWKSCIAHKSFEINLREKVFSLSHFIFNQGKLKWVKTLSFGYFLVVFKILERRLFNLDYFFDLMG